MGCGKAMKIPFRELFSGNGTNQAMERIDLLTVGEGDQVFQEQFRALRSKLEYKLDILGWKVVGLASAVSGEGKTLTCTKIAVSLARTKRKRVLLVDADVRKADLSKGFGIPPHPGLTEYLLGAVPFPDVVRKSTVPGLDMVPSGTSVPMPADLLAGDATTPDGTSTRPGRRTAGISFSNPIARDRNKCGRCWLTAPIPSS